MGCTEVNAIPGVAQISNDLENETCHEMLEIDSALLNPETAELIAKWLINKYRSKIIYNYIDEVFGDMDEEQRNSVYNSVCDIIRGRYSIEHLEYIKSKISDFLETDNVMNIDGFINFRLKGYKAEIKTLVEECGYDLMAYNDVEDMLEIINFLFDMSDL